MSMHIHGSWESTKRKGILINKYNINGRDYSDYRSWIFESRSVVRISKTHPNGYSYDCSTNKNS
jgi:hypothetical protein